MKVRAFIDHQRKLTTYTIYGEIIWDNLMSVIQDQIAGYLPLNTLWDLQYASIDHIPIDRLLDLIEMKKRIVCRTGGKTAVYHPEKRFYSYVIKQFEPLVALHRFQLPMRIKYFSESNDALTWLIGHTTASEDKDEIKKRNQHATDNFRNNGPLQKNGPRCRTEVHI